MIYFVDGAFTFVLGCGFAIGEVTGVVDVVLVVTAMELAFDLSDVYDLCVLSTSPAAA